MVNDWIDTSKMEKDLSLGNVDCADNCSKDLWII